MKIIFNGKPFQEGDILETTEKHNFKVVTSPHRKWYRVLLEWITFGLYKAPYQYTVKHIPHDKD